jgi:hydroxymethylglutaryl-CoA lyase
MTHRVHITDVTLREYGQNVPAEFLHHFAPEIRVQIARRLIAAGLTQLEVLSCVNPKVAPAMHPKALETISTALGRPKGVRLITLVPNRAGYKNFLLLGLGPDGCNHTMGVFFSAVEAHNRLNLGRSIQETIREYRTILKDARSRGISVFGYVSAAFGYRPSGGGSLIRPSMEQVTGYIHRLLDLGAEVVTLSDLQGVAGEEETRRLWEGIVVREEPETIAALGYHPHHVFGEKALANSRAAYQSGIRRFDASLGGTGGCVTGAPGNQPTAPLAQYFKSTGIETGLDVEEITSLTQMVRTELYDRIPLDKVAEV